MENNDDEFSDDIINTIYNRYKAKSGIGLEPPAPEVEAKEEPLELPFDDDETHFLFIDDEDLTP